MIEQPTPLVVSKDAAASKVTTDKLGLAVIRKFEQMRTLREAVESRWDETHELFRGDVTDMQNQRARSFQSAGAVNTWRHKVNTGMAFDVVETLVAYLKGATFPSDDWFDLRGAVPELGEAARAVKQLTKFKLEQCFVRDVIGDWLRNLCIFGVSTYRIGWCDEIRRTFKRRYGADGSSRDSATNKSSGSLTLAAMSPYDIWLDTGARLNQDGGVFCRLRHTREELHALVADGYYTMDSKDVERYEDYKFGDANSDKSAMANYSGGIAGDEIIEYYGAMLVAGVQYWCVHAVFFGRQLIRLTDSEYWCGVPYVTATMLPDRDSVYGMSVLHPNLGALHILNVLTNSRLDNIMLHVDKMWTLVEDGILKREDVRSVPGAVFKVAQHGSLQPIDMGAQNFVVTYQEAAVQEQAIYRNTSTGPLIGNAQPRAAERVTAAEINSVKDAGGNRLSSLHSHIEDAATLPLLQKVFTMLQQYYVTPEVVRMFVPEAGVDGFFAVEPENLHYPYTFLALGANYVVERERNMADLLQLLDISSRVPQIGEALDYAAILKDMLRQMRFSNPDKYVKPPAPAPTDAPVDMSNSLGGPQMASGFAQQMQADPQQMLQTVGVDASSVDPAQLTQLAGAMTNAGTVTPTDAGTAG